MDRLSHIWPEGEYRHVIVNITILFTFVHCFLFLHLFHRQGSKFKNKALFCLKISSSLVSLFNLLWSPVICSSNITWI